jgi:hypothetical protein
MKSVPIVQTVPMVQTLSFILPGDAEEDRGGGLNVLNWLLVGLSGRSTLCRSFHVSMNHAS